MAAEHDKIAACLRSDQDIEVCHKEMMKYHETMMHHHSMRITPPPPGEPEVRVVELLTES